MPYNTSVDITKASKQHFTMGIKRKLAGSRHEDVSGGSESDEWHMPICVRKGSRQLVAEQLAAMKLSSTSILHDEGALQAMKATLIEFYAMQICPWDLDFGDKKVFTTVFNMAFNVIAVERQVGQQKIHKWVRERIQEWRVDIQAVAQREVDAFFNAFKGPPHEIATYAQHAIQDGGAALWQCTDTEPPSGLFRSRFMLRTLAEHLRHVKGSRLAELSDLQKHGYLEIDAFPDAAVVLCACAIHLAFDTWATGHLKPGPEFSQASTADIWHKYARLVRINLFDQPPHFEALLNEAEVVLASESRRRFSWNTPGLDSE